MGHIGFPNLFWSCETKKLLPTSCVYARMGTPNALARPAQRNAFSVCVWYKDEHSSSSNRPLNCEREKNKKPSLPSSVLKRMCYEFRQVLFACASLATLVP